MLQTHETLERTGSQSKLTDAFAELLLISYLVFIPREGCLSSFRGVRFVRRTHAREAKPRAVGFTKYILFCIH
jgi:hypothetical protein